MKRKFTQISSFVVFLLAVSTSVNAQYHGNSDWSEKPDHALIYSTNFQDWYYEGATRSASADCGSGRIDRDNYDTFEMKGNVDAQQNMPNAKITFFADYCQIQPTCDTQSGQLYTSNPGGVGSGDNLGASWNNVSVGCMAIYDNYDGDRPNEAGVSGNGAGSFVTSKIAKLGAIQYTTSSYGKSRGFHLEIGYLQEDNSVRWDTIRYTPKGAALRYPEDMQTENMNESGRGMVWQENFTPARTKNVFIRIRPVTHERQIVRLHDLKIYGEAENSDGSDAVNPNTLPVYNEGSGIGNSLAEGVKIIGGNGFFTITEEADVNVYNMSGNSVKTITATTDIDLSDLANGAYIIKAITKSGVVTKQVIK
ncbi:T9SS type A sorting domain-containing protein [Dysgonomonas sp. 520]|uniref:T9SS type A sorting domain-containing protein n=1 Tax=Dysgonomonas sp. 520 TaxID=2302931 RepID=UPI0013D0DA9F|nr:T9SS type A sorting domain-containing protein [Dysgonomonas sp. 520]NDW09687.1 T9SS C-terminal target domain-containing protein [Dysgonomonas sp. 520]